MDPKIINNTCDTEESGTTTCIKGNPHDVVNMATNFSLTAGGVENCYFWHWDGQVLTKFDIVTPKTLLCEGRINHLLILLILKS